MNAILIPNGTPGNANYTSSTVTLLGSYKNAGLQIVWTGFNTTDAVVSIWESNDNVTFTESTAATYTIGQAAGSAVIPLLGVTCLYYQARLTKNTNSAGSVSGIINFTEK